MQKFWLRAAALGLILVAGAVPRDSAASPVLSEQQAAKAAAESAPERLTLQGKDYRVITYLWLDGMPILCAKTPCSRDSRHGWVDLVTGPARSSQRAPTAAAKIDQIWVRRPNEDYEKWPGSHVAVAHLETTQEEWATRDAETNAMGATEKFEWVDVVVRVRVGKQLIFIKAPHQRLEFTW